MVFLRLVLGLFLSGALGVNSQSTEQRRRWIWIRKNEKQEKICQNGKNGLNPTFLTFQAEYSTKNSGIGYRDTARYDIMEGPVTSLRELSGDQRRAESSQSY